MASLDAYRDFLHIVAGDEADHSLAIDNLPPISLPEMRNWISIELIEGTGV